MRAVEPRCLGPPGLFASACSTDDAVPPTSAAVAVGNLAKVAATPLPTGPAVEHLGRKIFFDVTLSAQGNQSCATCHDPAWGWNSPRQDINAGGGVIDGSVPGRFSPKKVMTAAYATLSPNLHFDATISRVVGGNFWDGRATGDILGNPAADQAMAPFLGGLEQAVADTACVLYRIYTGNYYRSYKKVWGDDLSQVNWGPDPNAACSTPAGGFGPPPPGAILPLSAADRAITSAAYRNVALSVAAFENSDEVNPFNSKFDHVIQGRGRFTKKEALGFALFTGKAQCATCHVIAGDQPLFTDQSYRNIGVPKNPLLEFYKVIPFFVDGGLFFRQPQFGPEHIGRSRTQTLRNVDKRGAPDGIKAYMHNGSFHSLEDVVHFYNTRAVLPDCATITAPAVAEFGQNCWPAPENSVNLEPTTLVGDLGLTADEERAIVAFLGTLTDRDRGRGNH